VFKLTAACSTSSTSSGHAAQRAGDVMQADDRIVVDDSRATRTMLRSMLSWFGST
jgi:hypothetical protein